MKTIVILDERRVSSICHTLARLGLTLDMELLIWPGKAGENLTCIAVSLSTMAHPSCIYYA